MSTSTPSAIQKPALVFPWVPALAWLRGPEPLQLVQKSALGKILGRSRMHFNLEQAVESYLKQFGDPK